MSAPPPPAAAFPVPSIEGKVAGALFGPRPRPPQGGVAVRAYREATMLVADVANLPGLAASSTPESLVALLDELLLAFERAARRHGVAPVAVRLQAFAAVAGVPEPRLDHARAAAEVALEIADAACGMATPAGKVVALRVGLHSGPLVAALDTARGDVRELWGESARVAGLMESRGVPGLVQVSGATAARLRSRYWLSPDARCRSRLAGLETYFVAGRKVA